MQKETFPGQGGEGSDMPRTLVSTLNPAVGACLLTPIPPVHSEDTNSAVFSLFEGDPTLHALAVIEGDRPIGLINRHTMIDAFARPFRHELFGRKPCTLFMDAEPLVVEHTTTLQAFSHQIANAAPRHLTNGFIITREGRYLGLGTGHDLVRRVTELQIRAARYANPLTQLPGNVPINERMDELLREERSFCVCYCDLDHFKPFNDK